MRLIYVIGRCAWVYASGNKLGFCERASEGYESKRDWIFFYSILYIYINIRTNKIQIIIIVIISIRKALGITIH